jgi:Phosphotransferase enzyme family
VPDRLTLGVADLNEAELSRVVADLLGHPEVDVLATTVRAVDDLPPAITTAGRWFLNGTARTPTGLEDFRLFVKHIQTWARSPDFLQVPPEHRQRAAQMVPWRTEACLYRSDLADRLPEGLGMPRAVAVLDLDEESAVLWLEAVDSSSGNWTPQRYADAAHLIGRLAASRAVAPLAGIGEFEWSARDYLSGRLALQVLPMLGSEEIWAHPLVASAFDDGLRGRLLAAAERAASYVEELEALPHTASHGDACPSNLLPRPDHDGAFTLIDFGFWMPQPIGFDLGQLLVGDAQIGRMRTSQLPLIERTILPAYVAGLAAEGTTVTESLVRRAHALQLLIFNGLSALPLEHLAAEPTPELAELASERARLARFSLDLIDATA